MESSIIIRKYQEPDAPELLRMWKESQAGWPAGLSLASGNSPEHFHRNLTQGSELAHFVAEAPSVRRIVGYCGLTDEPLDSRFSILPLLNVHPSWQKRGIGRMLITAVVDEAIAHGFHRIALGTWPGNIYAVGLYKRCGFCWIPETEIYMVNYLPLIRTTPLLQKFFKLNDWYDSLRVEKTSVPDDHKIGKMKVFQYRFEGQEGPLTVTIDRNATAISGIETDRMKLELLSDDSEGWRGFQRHFICRVHNRETEPVKGTIVFEGRHGFEAGSREAFCLDPGTDYHKEIIVDVPGDLENPHHGPCPSIVASLCLNEQDVTLEAGLKTELPVEFRFFDSDTFIQPGRMVQNVLNVENHLPFPISLNLTLNSGTGMIVSPKTIGIELPAQSLQGIPLELVSEPGRHTLEIEAVDTSRPEQHLPVVRREICGRSFGGIGWVESKDQIIARNEFIQVIASRQSGRIMILDARYDCGLTVMLPDPGPPFPYKPSDSNPVISCKMENAQLIITVESDSSSFHGVNRMLKLTIGDSLLIHLSGHIITRESSLQIPSIRHAVSAGRFHSETVIPTRDGILSHSEAAFPFGPEDLSHAPGDYPESWFMLKYDRSITGFLWTGIPDDITFAEWKIVTLTYNDVTITPDRPWILPDSYVYIGPGDEKTIQNLWAGVSFKAPKLHVQPLIGFDRSIAPLIVQGNETIQLELCNRREFSESGKLIIDGCRDAGLNRRRIPIKNLNRDRPHNVSLEIKPRNILPVCRDLVGTFRSDAFDVPVSVPMILFPEDERNVSIEQTRKHNMDTFQLRNGRMEMELVPAFHGALTSLTYNGINLIRSPFPDTGVLGFESPWYGGITPEIRVVHHETADIHWSGHTTSANDNRGTEWIGIRLDSGIIPNTNNQRLTATMDYLTIPGCPLLAARLQIKNIGSAFSYPVITQLVFPGPNNHPSDHVAFSKYGKTSVRHLSSRRGVFPFESWLGFTSEATSPGLAIVQGNSQRKAQPILIDIGKDGFYVYTYDYRKLDPGDVFDLTLFLVPFEGNCRTSAGFESLKHIHFP